MGSGGRILGRSLLVAASCGLLGCAAIDNFSPRAIDYNLQAEQAQQQALLLNIVRASLRRPMQFTSLQSITGTASVSGTVSGGNVNTRQTPYISLFPFPTFIPANTNTALTGIVTNTVGASAALGGAATFTVPVLDTQEFYQGILNPINLQVVDFYVQQGFPRELLLNLFVARIVVTRIDNGTCNTFTFVNAVGSDIQLNQFQALIEYLHASGLTTERIEAGGEFGPPIALTQANGSADDAAKLLDAYSKAASAGLDVRSESRGAHTALRVRQKAARYRFCFEHAGGRLPFWLGTRDAGMFCGFYNRRARAPATPGIGSHRCTLEGSERGVQEGAVSHLRGIRLAPEFIHRIRQIQADELARKGSIPADQIFRTEDFEGGLVSFEVFTRSTQGMLYYLGEVVRRQQAPEGEPRRVVQIKSPLRYGIYPMSSCDDAENGGRTQRKQDAVYFDRRRSGEGPPPAYNCENLFRVNADGSPDTVLAVDYEGQRYSIPKEPSAVGRSTQVLELVKQLFALNTSAKQLPATTVLSVINQP